MMMESTIMRERAISGESTTLNERAEHHESTIYGE